MPNPINELKQIISPVYQVGGSVRDELLGIEPKDYDFTTPIAPDEIERRIKEAGKRAYSVGKKYGTVGVKLNGALVEVTTFRKELYIPGSRKPTVEFVESLSDDLSRRDFTINAIARDEHGGICDPYSGRADLALRIIRAVDDPGTRFSEDPLRLLRMCRFMGQLGCTVEDKTFIAAQKRAYTILNISRERWVAELDRILSQTDPTVSLEAMHEVGILKYMIPELDMAYGYDQESPYHQHDLWTHTMEVIKLVPQDQLELRWVALFHDLGKIAVAKRKVFNPTAAAGSPEMQRMRDEYAKMMMILGGPTKDMKLLPLFQKNFVHHERLSAEIAKRYCAYLKFSNDRSEFIINNVKDHMREDAILKPYDREGH